MRYSLSNRFQAALLGAALGEILGTHCQVRHQAKRPLVWVDVSDWGFASLTNATDATDATAWGRVAVQLARGLIQGGGGESSWIDEVFDVLTTSFPRSAPKLAAPVSDAVDSAAAMSDRFRWVGAGLAIASLPIALFFHADPDQLEQQLQQADAVWQHQPDLKDGVTAVGYALSLALREQLDPDQFIAEILEELLSGDRPSSKASMDFQGQSNHQSNYQSSFIKQLQLVQSLTKASPDKTDPEPATGELRHRLKVEQLDQPDTLSIALAFYCFLNTPEDFRLSVTRAAQLHSSPQTVSITAALSGAYNGINSIPLSWRSALNHANAENSQSPLMQLWGLASETELRVLSDQLLAAWSGTYDLVQLLNYPSQTLAVAAPWVIRPKG
jgi:ADP-ribosylglycohydrolase